MRFTIYQESRQGGRQNNEDRVAHSYSRDALLMALADGMGGHHYGEIAAQIAVQTLINAFQQEARPTLDDPFIFLQEHIDQAHYAILDFVEAHKLDDSPRTTILACIVQENVAFWAHAGDSRLYLIRKNRVISQTRDHSQIRYLLDEGLISQAEAEHHPDRNKVYSCLGGRSLPEIAFSRKTPLESGDLLVLCTDGVWSTTSSEALVQALRYPNLIQSVPQFMQQLEQQGGPNQDNLSMVVARWEENYVEFTPSSISTQGMRQDEIAATLADFGRHPHYKSDLSDEEIEEAIREIHAAIEKFTPRK